MHVDSLSELSGPALGSTCDHKCPDYISRPITLLLSAQGSLSSLSAVATTEGWVLGAKTEL